MSIAGEIKQVAAKLAVDAQHRLEHLQEELAEVEIRKSEIEAQLMATRPSPERAFSFRPEVGGELQCPRCWVDQGIGSILTAVAAREGCFRCEACHFEFAI